MPRSASGFDVSDFGARGDGKTDDTEAIQAALNAAAPSDHPTGNAVIFPAGTYRVTSALMVPPAVTLEGVGWNTPGSQANVFAGSWIFVEAAAPFSPVTMSGGGSSVRRLGFNVPDQNNSGTPAAAGAMVLVAANNVLIEDVFVYNPYVGVRIDGAAQCVVRRLFGQPIHCGVEIDGSRDSNYIDSVHFWPYWQPVRTATGAYQLANGTGIKLSRCDNPHLSNVFALHYNVGLGLSSSDRGIPHKVHLANADFDGCATGIRISSPGSPTGRASLMMTNVTTQSPASGAPNGNGILVETGADYAMVQASNVRIARSSQEAIRIDADNASLYGENVSLEHWSGDYGFYISSRSSYAWLGVGCIANGPGRSYHPSSQFHLAKYT